MLGGEVQTIDCDPILIRLGRLLTRRSRDGREMGLEHEMDLEIGWFFVAVHDVASALRVCVTQRP